MFVRRKHGPSSRHQIYISKRSKRNVSQKLWTNVFQVKKFSFGKMFCCICVIHKFGCKTETLDLPSMVVVFFFFFDSTAKIYSLWKYYREFVSTWQRKTLFGIRNLFAKLFVIISPVQQDIIAIFKWQRLYDNKNAK